MTFNAAYLSQTLASNQSQNCQDISTAKSSHCEWKLFNCLKKSFKYCSIFSASNICLEIYSKSYWKWLGSFRLLQRINRERLGNCLGIKKRSELNTNWIAVKVSVTKKSFLHQFFEACLQISNILLYSVCLDDHYNKRD